MKKLLKSLLAGSFILLTIAGCSSSPSSSAEELDSLAKIKKNGELVVVTSPDYPPMEYIGPDGKVVGFDIELAQIIADKIGVDLKVDTTDFDGVLATIATGEADMALAGLVETEERAESMDFSDSYTSGEQTLIIRAEDKDKYTDVKSFADATIAAQLASLQEDLAKEIVKDEKQIKQIKGLSEIVLEVVNGDVDAAVISRTSAERYASNYPDLMVVDFNINTDYSGSKVAVPKGDNESLLKLVNGVIKSLKDSDKLDKMYEDAVEASYQEK